MAGRNLKSGSGQGNFDPVDKIHTNTLKRHPKMELSASELLQLLSYLEGELQARDVAIAALKAEKAKQLLYQAKYGRFGLGDPFTAMQRDSDNMKDNAFDEHAIKSMYDNQLAQLENLIATQRKAQMKMREQLLGADKRYHKVCSELDDEKHKHAQDTAQGDDVTYMLEKERERLKQEVDFEKANTKKMEKDLKKTLACLEEERANSAKHKQVALMLIKERKKLIETMIGEKQKAMEAEKCLSEEKHKAMNISEGLVQESKKSLKMEATLEKQISEFEIERESLRSKLHREEVRNKDLQGRLDALVWQMENSHKQSTGNVKESFQNIEIKSAVSSPHGKVTVDRSDRSQAWMPSSVHSNSPSGKKSVKSAVEATMVEREAGLSPRHSPSELSVRKRDGSRHASPQPVMVERGGHHYLAAGEGKPERIGPVGADRSHEPHKINVSHEPQKLNVLGGSSSLSAGGRISVQTGSPTSTLSAPVSPRKVLAIGRGVPPPIPPNKPVLTSQIAMSKPSPPPKVGVAISKDNRVTVLGGDTSIKHSAHGTSKPIQIPVNVVHTSTAGAGSGTRTPKREGSPSTMRKPAQPPDHGPSSDPPTTAPAVSDSFDFLGPEMADLQQLLVSMVTGSTDSSSLVPEPAAITESLSTSTAALSPASASTSITSSLELDFTAITSEPMSSSSVTQASQQECVSITSVYDSKLSWSVTRSNPVSATSSQFAQMQRSNTCVSSTLPPATISACSVLLPSTCVSTRDPPRSTLTSTRVSTPKSAHTVTTPLTSLHISPRLDNTSVPTIPVLVPPPFTPVTTSRSSPTKSTFTSRSTSVTTTSVSTSYPASISRTLTPMSAPAVGPVLHVSPVSGMPRPISTVSPVLTSSSRSAATVTMSATPLRPKQAVNIPSSPIHKFASTGNIAALRKLIVELDADVNLPMKDGTTPTHCAVEHGQEACLQLLIERGANVNVLRDDHLSPVHSAAAEGHTSCLHLLLSGGGDVAATDHSNWTPLHWAAANGHLECCHLLLQYGADRLAFSNANWTPCHHAIHSGCVDCLHLLLTHDTHQSGTRSKFTVEVANMVDKDGWTIAHLAALRESHDCLSVILLHCDIDVDCRDRWGRSVLDVASPQCRQLLVTPAASSRITCRVELRCGGSLYANQEAFVIGSVDIWPYTDWPQLQEQLDSLLEHHLKLIDRGLRTKKTSRLDPETNVDNSQYSLGLTKDSIQCVTIGQFSIENDEYPSVSLQDIMCNNNVERISLTLHGSGERCDSLAFDLLLPLPVVQNYLRLVEQYKSVVFYGPEGTRKQQLTKRLATLVAESEASRGMESHVSHVYLHQDFTHVDFLHLLKSKGCLVCVGEPRAAATAPILVLFHLEKVGVAQTLGPLLEHVDHRGAAHTFYITGADGRREPHYLVENFHLMATMDKSRSTGLDLSIQQRFRWIHFRIDHEPIKHLLARFLLRRLVHTYDGEMPPSDDPVFKAVEWVVCVWQRLNDGLAKLGLPDVVFGPDLFLPCPLECRDPLAVFEWLTKLWNETISPAVRVAVSRGTGKDTSGDGQQKVANTALYVLMQRAIVPGCPLTGEDKVRYLGQFCGSNELDVSLRTDRTSPTIASIGHRRPVHSATGIKQHSDPLQSRPRQRNSPGSDGTQLKWTAGSPGVKRRSLSAVSLAHTDEPEMPIVDEPADQRTNIQAKVPKLEIRSPVLALTVPDNPSNSNPTGWSSPPSNLGTNPHSSLATSPNNLGTSPSNLGTGHDNSRRSTFSSTSRSRIPQPTVSSKRSRSSENLSSLSAMQTKRNGQFRATSPFSFSLTTPTSSLFSFKFLEASGRKADRGNHTEWTNTGLNNKT